MSEGDFRYFDCKDYYDCLDKLAHANAPRFDCKKDCPRIVKLIQEVMKKVKAPAYNTKPGSPEIDQRIHDRMLELKMENRQFCEKAGISTSVGTRIRRGQHVGLPVWERIAKALDMTVEEVLKGKPAENGPITIESRPLDNIHFFNLKPGEAGYIPVTKDEPKEIPGTLVNDLLIGKIDEPVPDFVPFTMEKTSETYTFKGAPRQEVEITIDSKNEVSCRFEAATEDNKILKVEITQGDLEFLAQVQRQVQILLALTIR